MGYPKQRLPTIPGSPSISDDEDDDYRGLTVPATLPTSSPATWRTVVSTKKRHRHQLPALGSQNVSSKYDVFRSSLVSLVLTGLCLLCALSLHSQWQMLDSMTASWSFPTVATVAAIFNSENTATTVILAGDNNARSTMTTSSFVEDNSDPEGQKKTSQSRNLKSTTPGGNSGKKSVSFIVEEPASDKRTAGDEEEDESSLVVFYNLHLSSKRTQSVEAGQNKTSLRLRAQIKDQLDWLLPAAAPEASKDSSPAPGLVMMVYYDIFVDGKAQSVEKNADLSNFIKSECQGHSGGTLGTGGSMMCSPRFKQSVGKESDPELGLLQQVYNYCKEDEKAKKHQRIAVLPNTFKRHSNKQELVSALTSRECRKPSDRGCNLCSLETRISPFVHTVGNAFQTTCGYVQTLIPPADYSKAVAKVSNTKEAVQRTTNLEAAQKMSPMASWIASSPQVHPCTSTSGTSTVAQYEVTATLLSDQLFTWYHMYHEAPRYLSPLWSLYENGHVWKQAVALYGPSASIHATGILHQEAEQVASAIAASAATEEKEDGDESDQTEEHALAIPFVGKTASEPMLDFSEPNYIKKKRTLEGTTTATTDAVPSGSGDDEATANAPWTVFYNIPISFEDKFNTTSTKNPRMDDDAARARLLKIVDEQLYQLATSYAISAGPIKVYYHFHYPASTAFDDAKAWLLKDSGADDSKAKQVIDFVDIKSLCQHHKNLKCHPLQSYLRKTKKKKATDIDPRTKNTTSGSDFYYAHIPEKVLSLQGMYEYCQARPKDATKPLHRVIHMQTSTTTAKTPEAETNWRKNLLHAVTSPDCLEKRDEPHATPANSTGKCNVCGLVAQPWPYLHYSDNFFASDCDYISKLLPPVDLTPRMDEIVSRALYKRITRDELDMTLFPEDGCHYGGGPFAMQYWITSHPDMVPCELATNPSYELWQSKEKPADAKKATAEELEATADLQFDKATFPRPGHSMFRPFSYYNNVRSKCPQPYLDKPWQYIIRVRALSRREASLRPREYFALAGYFMKWYDFYGKIPEDADSWAYKWYPDGAIWRQAGAEHGADAVDRLTYNAMWADM